MNTETSENKRKKTVVIGASPNSGRYAYLASNMLKEYSHPVVPMGIHPGEVAGETIVDLKSKPAIADVDTVTLYIGPQRQPEWYEYILSLKPKRIIFNPGTENDQFEQMAEEHGIEATEACTLVLLRSNQY